MKILLLGATGQIGSALMDALVRTPHQLSVLVRDRDKVPSGENVTVHEAELFTPKAFAAALTEADCVIYGVGIPEQFTFDPLQFQRTNYDLLHSFLEVLGASPVRRLVYLSTYEVFQPLKGIIRESHPLAPAAGKTPYFQTMIHAYQLVLDYAQRLNLSLTTIHPAAVYGGRGTGDGFTNYLENLIQRRIWKVPAIVNGRFPVVHAHSLAIAIVSALDHKEAFIITDQMTSLREMALLLREHTPAFVPPTIPLFLARANASILETVARFVQKRPIMSRVQLDFITQGWEPRADKAQKILGWQPLPLRQGLQNFLRDKI